MRRWEFLSLMAGLVASAFLMSSPAHAQQYVCGAGPGPGEVLAGMNPATEGVASVPLCAPAPSGATASGNATGSRLTQAIARFQADALKQRTAGTDPEKREALKKDSQHQRFVKGDWDFFQDAPNAPAGETCAALFTNSQGVVRLLGPGGDFKGAMLTFWGPDVPRPQTVRTLKVTLSQTGEAPRILSVLNAYNPRETLGAVIFALPSVESALDGTLDVYSFDLSMDGKSIAHIDWTGGFAARDKLRQCVGQKAGK